MKQFKNTYIISGTIDGHSIFKSITAWDIFEAIYMTKTLNIKNVWFI